MAWLPGLKQPLKPQLPGSGLMAPNAPASSSIKRLIRYPYAGAQTHRCSELAVVLANVPGRTAAEGQIVPLKGLCVHREGQGE